MLTMSMLACTKAPIGRLAYAPALLRPRDHCWAEKQLPAKRKPARRATLDQQPNICKATVSQDSGTSVLHSIRASGSRNLRMDPWPSCVDFSVAWSLARKIVERRLR
jgi:hypothetical protein